MYAISDYHYELPAELIAQKPNEARDQSNLLALNRKTGELSHHRFAALDNFFHPGDVIIVNNTSVIPGKLVGRKESGGKVEVLICSFNGNCKLNLKNEGLVYECLVKAAKPSKPGSAFYFDEGLSAEVIERRNETYVIKFYAAGDFEILLDRIGELSLIHI